MTSATFFGLLLALGILGLAAATPGTTDRSLPRSEAEAAPVRIVLSYPMQ